MPKMITEYDEVKEILNKHPEAYKKVLDDGDIYDDEKLYGDLFEYYAFGPDPDVYMPYGTMKARDGDPVIWITERLEDLGLLETVLEEDGMGFQVRGFKDNG